MTCAPHQRLTTCLLHFVEQNLRCLHVGDDRAAGMVLENVTRQQNEDLVTPEDAALVVHKPDTISVAVEGDTEVGLVLFDRSDDLLEVLRNRRVGW